MSHEDISSPKSGWFRWSIMSLVLLTLGSFVVGFVVLPSVHPDFTARNLWDSICRAAGVPATWSLAAYYAFLPKARTASTTYDERLLVLVRVGDPLRNIVPCIACHGGVDQKFGAPWIEGMPKEYLATQLHAFKMADRRNECSRSDAQRGAVHDGCGDRRRLDVLCAQGCVSREAVNCGLGYGRDKADCDGLT